MKQAALTVMLMIVGFAVALVVFIAGQLSAPEVALLAGAICGMGVAVPVGVVAGSALAARRRPDPTPPTPLVIYVTQPTTPAVVGSALPQARLPQPQMTTPSPRSLNIIGQTGFDSEE